MSAQAITAAIGEPTLDPVTTNSSQTRLWAGRILTVLTGAFLALDGVMKLVKPRQVLEATMQLGFAESALASIGIALLACTILYLIPRTAIPGAVLLTGYLGGAVASQVRIGAPLFSTLFPIIFAVLVWSGLYLRDERLKAIL